ERLLFVLDDPPDKQYNIMDPYNLTNSIGMSEFFEENEIQEPFIIKSDKIIYIIDGKVSIKDLVHDNSDDWVKYLRKELKDTNSITTPCEKTIEIIRNRLNNNCNAYITDNNEFPGNYLKWGLELSHKSVMITVLEFNYRKKDWHPDSKKKCLKILPSFYPDEKKFILHCEVLYNDDFITITRIGVIIWTFKLCRIAKTKIIKMHYYWNNCNRSLEDFVLDNNGSFDFEEFKDLFNDWTLGRILPPSKLSENHPAFIASTLSYIAFVVPSAIVDQESTSSHLSSYGRYCHLSKTSFFDILTSNILDHLINFQESFQKSFQKFKN
ncbi:1257_t:CDS:2, partial [Scutellospora calospora]